MMERRPPPPPPMMRDEMMFDGDGGNYWVNPTNSLDGPPVSSVRDGPDGRMARGGRRGSMRRRDQLSSELPASIYTEFGSGAYSDYLASDLAP